MRHERSGFRQAGCNLPFAGTDAGSGRKIRFAGSGAADGGATAHIAPGALVRALNRRPRPDLAHFVIGFAAVDAQTSGHDPGLT